MNEQLVYIDCETTGLDLDRHEIWEVALIDEATGFDHVWQLPVDLGRADPIALAIGGYYERRTTALWELAHFADNFEECTRGKHLVGANVAFDAYRLEKLMKANGACPGWHYHLIDVEALMLGALGWRRRHFAGTNGEPQDPATYGLTLPWKSGELCGQFEVDSEDPAFAPKHSALGDARWARACYYAVMGEV